ncbi:MAG TPA: glycosyltransferase family 4 protein, partial [Candidatus Polarisedimenticolaceae bacterium]|nr:glycosyltransferase family 4 protein [Candidatus Polarisedimenticolaceae bacterium]
MDRLKVAMIAPPWLSIPPSGYGGIEYVLQVLIRELEKRGAQVTLFTVGDADIAVHDQKSLFPEPTYSHLGLPLYDAATVPLAHILFALNHIKNAGFDIIHDHNPEFGAALLANLDAGSFPPVLHTIHNSFDGHGSGMAKHPLYEQASQASRMWFNAISHAQVGTAPQALEQTGLPVVYNALDPELYPFRRDKENFFLTMARFTQNKGQAVAAKLCAELGYKLKMAGSINGLSNPRDLQEVQRDASHPANQHPDYQYYQREVASFEKTGAVEYMGNVSGKPKLRLMSAAKALLFPIDWDEPFGLAVIEAMACGTPVVAMKRGAMAELIEHGVNGYLADSIPEFKYYMQRVHEIDPEDCRATVEQQFSGDRMAEDYLNLY